MTIHTLKKNVEYNHLYEMKDRERYCFSYHVSDSVIKE